LAKVLIKTLFVASNPKSTNKLSLDEEIREIKEKIRLSKYRNAIDLDSIWAARPDDLIQSLNEQRPHIVHFSGHGTEQGEIILVDNYGIPQPVSPTLLKKLFETLKDNIRVVILNACYSEIQAKAIVESIDCVIGMSGAIEDQASITFAASFYRAIGFGKSIKDAFDQALLSIMFENIDEENVPQLLHKPGLDPSKLYLINASTVNYWTFDNGN